MKKAILIIVLFLNLIPFIKDGKLGFIGPQTAYAQYNGGTEQNTDQCDQASPSYDATACEQATCDPGSVNYNKQECDAQACDASSANYDATKCEQATCDPTNVNYNKQECDAQACDASSANYDATKCEQATCDPTNVNYNKQECEAQACDASSANYDATKCEQATCDPTNVNYNKQECEAQACDASSANYDATKCEQATCDPANVNYNKQECEAQSCDASSANYDATKCEQATCDPTNVNYNKQECEAQVCDDTSVNFDATKCEQATCDPTNVNYNKQECEAQVCDDTSVNFDATKCEQATCDPTNVNYNKDECDKQKCDPTSINYDQVECEKEKCQPSSANYDPSVCGSCNASSSPTTNVTQVAPSTQNSLSYLRTHQQPAFGETAPEAIHITIGACNDGTTWTAVLKVVEGQYSETYDIWGGSEVTGISGNTNQSNFCDQLTSLASLAASYNPQGTPPVWYVVAAVKAHEDVHQAHLLPALNNAISDIENLVHSLTVPANGQTESAVVSQILAANPNLESDSFNLWATAFSSLAQADHSGSTDAAEHAIVDPLIASICAYATAQGWSCSTYTCH
jgi:hypothetical protein